MNNDYLSKTSTAADKCKMSAMYSLEKMQIICPWCFNITKIATDFEEECQVCRRFICELDMEAEDDIT